MSGYHTLFGKEVQNCLYPFFWQHGEKHEVLGEYIDKIYESQMKAVCIEARPHPDFAGIQWWKDVDFILQKLKEKNMKMWILDDSHFPTGFANGKIKSDYPEFLKLYLDCRRYDVQGPIKQARINLKFLKGKPWDNPENNLHIMGVYMAERLLHREEDYDSNNDSIDVNTIIDITEKMRMSDRLLSVDIPAGAYSIFVVYETRKGLEDATKDYLNPLVKEATQVLIDEVYEPHYDHYSGEFGKTILGFFSDEPRFGNMKGTDCGIGKDMPLPWRTGLEKLLDFDLKYLPLLWTSANAKVSEIRLQYMDLITKLYNHNFTKVLADWCEKHGVWYLGHTIEDNGAHARLGYGTGHYFRGQQSMHAAGIDVIGTQIVPGMDYHHDAFNTGGSNGEFYQYALAKLGSSAAHLDSKKDGRVLCEAFGAYGWNEGLKAMKWIADSLMVRGVNYIVPHAFNPKQFPDWDCPPHFYAQGHNPQFRYFKVLDEYMNRVMSVFRDGKHPAGVGVFYPAESEWMGAYMPIEKPARELTQNQISYDIISRDFIKESIVEEGCFCINGNRFEVLIFPYSESIPADLIEILYKMTKKKVKFIFLKEYPVNIVGLYDRKMWNFIKEHSIAVPLGELGLILHEYQAIQIDRKNRSLTIGEYLRDQKNIYMLFNESTVDTIDAAVQFKKEGYVYMYDAFEDILYNFCTGRIHLSPYESAIFIVTKEKLEAADLKDDEHYVQVSLPEKWIVKFANSTSYPDFQVIPEMDTFGFVHTLAGWEDKAGTVQFHTEVEFADETNALLDLGNTYETAQVFVNNISVGIRLCKPYIFDLSEHLHKGKNEIKIEITNTLGTQIRDALSQYLPIEPFGIEGPVKLMIKTIDSGNVLR